MSYNDMLIHECDVFHQKLREIPGTYGKPTTKEYYYDSAPDIVQEPCYFYERTTTVIQTDPFQSVSQWLSVQFSPDSSVLHNDKVIFKGESFFIRKPRLIRDHHMEAAAERVNHS